jgi:hypothetical protein
LAHHHPLQPKKKSFDVGFSWVAGNDNKPLGSSLSPRTFSSLVEDDDKSGSSSLFLTFFPHL